MMDATIWGNVIVEICESYLLIALIFFSETGSKVTEDEVEVVGSLKIRKKI